MSEKSFQDLAHDEDHLVEKRISGEGVYDGIFLKMKRDTVSLPDGQHALREYLEHPGAVAILAVLDDGRILLERQYRYPISQAVIAVIASLIGAFYYLRVVKVMYFDEPVHEQSVNGTSFAKGILGINGLMILILGIFPAGLMSLCLNAMRSTLIGS